MFDGSPVEFGAELFWWIVFLIVGLVAALTLIDFRSLMSPQKPFEHPEDHDAYWKSRKHAEDVHKEFSDEKPSADMRGSLRG